MTLKRSGGNSSSVSENFACIFGAIDATYSHRYTVRSAEMSDDDSRKQQSPNSQLVSRHQDRAPDVVATRTRGQTDLAGQASGSIPVDGLVQVIYWMSAGRDDFDIFGFREALPEHVRDNDDSAVFVAPNSSASDYHAFFAWSVTDEEISLSVEYRAGKMSDIAVFDDEEGEDVEAGPSADHLMAWLGGFFKDKSAPSHLHVRYRYPYDSRKSAIPFSIGGDSPLPHNAEIYGVALRLPDKPGGATSVRLTQERSDWYAEVIADRDVNFAEFSLFADAASLQAVLRTFLVEGVK
jgi:hypothetical protein